MLKSFNKHTYIRETEDSVCLWSGECRRSVVCLIDYHIYLTTNLQTADMMMIDTSNLTVLASIMYTIIQQYTASLHVLLSVVN